MKKKKIFLILTMILILMLSGYILPIAIINNFTKVTLISPYTIDVYNDVNVSGEIKEVDVSQVVSNIPIITNNVLVKVGDDVKANQPIATIDRYATQDAILSIVDNLMQTSSYMQNMTELFTLLDMFGVDIAELNNNINDEVLAVSANTIPTTIKATADGTITSLDLVKGGIIFPQSVVCTISKTDELYVELQINEDNINQVTVGDIVLFKSIANEDDMYQGKITTIFPTATKSYQGITQKTVVGAYVELDEKYENLKAGYNIVGVIKDNTKTNALILPYETIMQDSNNNEFVYIYEENRAIKQIITTGKELPQGVEILSGVTENSTIIYNSKDVKNHGDIVL